MQLCPHLKKFKGKTELFPSNILACQKRKKKKKLQEYCRNKKKKKNEIKKMTLLMSNTQTKMTRHVKKLEKYDLQ